MTTLHHTHQHRSETQRAEDERADALRWSPAIEGARMTDEEELRASVLLTSGQVLQGPLSTLAARLIDEWDLASADLLSNLGLQLPGANVVVLSRRPELTELGLCSESAMLMATLYHRPMEPRLQAAEQAAAETTDLDALSAEHDALRHREIMGFNGNDPVCLDELSRVMRGEAAVAESEAFVALGRAGQDQAPLVIGDLGGELLYGWALPQVRETLCGERKTRLRLTIDIEYAATSGDLALALELLQNKLRELDLGAPEAAEAVHGLEIHSTPLQVCVHTGKVPERTEQAPSPLRHT